MRAGPLDRCTLRWPRRKRANERARTLPSPARWTKKIKNDRTPAPPPGAVQSESSSRVQIAGKTVFRNNSVDGWGGETDSHGTRRPFTHRTSSSSSETQTFVSSSSVGKSIVPLFSASFACRASGRREFLSNACKIYLFLSSFNVLSPDVSTRSQVLEVMTRPTCNISKSGGGINMILPPPLPHPRIIHMYLRAVLHLGVCVCVLFLK